LAAYFFIFGANVTVIDMRNKIFFALLALMTLISYSRSQVSVFYARDYSNTDSIYAHFYTKEGIISFQLNFEQAPQTVAQFEWMLSEGFFKGARIGRIQGGLTMGIFLNPQVFMSCENRFIPDEGRVREILNPFSLYFDNLEEENTSTCDLLISQKANYEMGKKVNVIGRAIDGQVLVLLEEGDEIQDVRIEERFRSAEKL
jgi:cyclophilin family peptidyl-prolyl cis-trans isomerase